MPLRLTVPPADKTRSFHDQIEVKQKELQPWTIEINQKQAKIDLAKSERETLARKFEVVREAKEEAENTKNRLQGEKETKVSVTPFFQCDGHDDLQRDRKRNCGIYANAKLEWTENSTN